jgi:hypothetical protein
MQDSLRVNKCCETTAFVYQIRCFGAWEAQDARVDMLDLSGVAGVGECVHVCYDSDGWLGAESVEG